MSKGPFLVALLSVGLYAGTAIVSFCFYYRLRVEAEGQLRASQVDRNELISESSPSLLQTNRTKRVIQRKKIFFSLMCVSSLLNIPFFAQCAGMRGPENCIWNGAGCNIGLISHVISNCGFCVLLSIPPLMWSEIIQGRVYDQYSSYGWFSCSCRNRFEFAKRLIAVCGAVYIATQLVVIGGLFWSLRNADDTTSFLISKVYFSALITESCAIIIQIISWLFVSLQLQCYVIAVKFERHEQRRILIRINATLIALCCCYAVRAYFLFFIKSPPIYLVWVLCVYWLPYVVCSWLLMALMSRREKPKRETIVRVESSLNKFGEIDQKTCEAMESTYDSVWDGDADVFPAASLRNNDEYHQGNSSSASFANQRLYSGSPGGGDSPHRLLSAEFGSPADAFRFGGYYDGNTPDLIDKVSIVNTNSDRGSYKAPRLKSVDSDEQQY